MAYKGPGGTPMWSSDVAPSTDIEHMLRTKFSQLDLNGDGFLSFEEMRDIMRMLNPAFSENQLQQLFVQMDANRNGLVELREFCDYMLDGKKSLPSVKFHSPESDPSAWRVSEQWKMHTLATHNHFRAAHGSPDLTWSDECYLSAKKQADCCQDVGAMFHNNCEGPSGRHGQNIYWCSAPGSSPWRSIKSWYDEILEPGYNFDNHDGGEDEKNEDDCEDSYDHKYDYDYDDDLCETQSTIDAREASGCGHFTQVVWKGTTAVGMAASEDGRFVVANYYPAGNMLGEFPSNVQPRSSSYDPDKEVAPEPCGGAAVMGMGGALRAKAFDVGDIISRDDGRAGTVLWDHTEVSGRVEVLWFDDNSKGKVPPWKLKLVPQAQTEVEGAIAITPEIKAAFPSGFNVEIEGATAMTPEIEAALTGLPAKYRCYEYQLEQAIAAGGAVSIIRTTEGGITNLAITLQQKQFGMTMTSKMSCSWGGE